MKRSSLTYVFFGGLMLTGLALNPVFADSPDGFSGSSAVGISDAADSYTVVYRQQEDEFIASLIGLRLFRLARMEVLGQMKQADLSVRQQADLMVQFLEITGEETLAAPAAEQKTILDQSRQMAQTFLDRYEGHPLGLMIRYTLLSQQKSHSELAAMNCQLRPGDKPVQENARSLLRETLRAANDLEEVFENPANAVERQSGQRFFSDSQWTALKNQVTLLSAQLYIDQSFCYPDGSPEQADAQQSALARLKKLGGLLPKDSLYWQVRLERIRILRRSGNYQQAEQAINLSMGSAVQTGDSDTVARPPAELIQDFQAEQLAIWFKTDRPKAMTQLEHLQDRLNNSFIDGSTVSGNSGGLDGLSNTGNSHSSGRSSDRDAGSDDALHLAVLECLTGLWREAMVSKNTAEQKHYQQLAIQWSEKMQRYDRGFYAQSARQIIASAAMEAVADTGNTALFNPQVHGAGAATNPDPENLTLMVMAAENAYRAGQTQDAVAMYEKAAQLAPQNPSNPTDGTKSAFDLLYTAAAIVHTTGDHAQAMAKFHTLAVAYPQHPNAPKAFLLAIVNAEKTIDQTRQETIDQYASLLDEFLKLFPADAKADRLRAQRLKLLPFQGYTAEQKLATCRQMLDAMTTDSPLYTTVLLTALKNADEILAAYKQQGRSYTTEAGEYYSWFCEKAGLNQAGGIATGGVSTGGAVKWTPVSRQTVIRLAYWKHEYTRQTAQAIELLQTAIRENTSASTTVADRQWYSSANAMLITLLIASGRTSEALTLTDRILEAGPEELMTLSRQIEQQVESLPETLQPTAAAAAINALQIVQQRSRQEVSSGGNSVKLDAKSQTELQRRLAKMLLLSKRADEALDLYETLVKQYPNESEVQIGYARALSGRLTDRSPDAERQKALNQWRAVAGKSKPQSDPWYTAKYEVAVLLIKTGQKSKAVEMIQLMQLLHPDFGSPENKARFEKLLL